MVLAGTTEPNCSSIETRRYMAYEMVHGGMLFTEKTDVWAFGMAVYVGIAIRDLDGWLITTIPRNLLLENGLIVPTQKVRYAHL